MACTELLDLYQAIVFALPYGVFSCWSHYHNLDPNTINIETKGFNGIDH
jgi:hypothetical protein